MIKTEFMNLYEELNTLTEDYALEANGYKVGDLIKYEDIKHNDKTGKNETIYRHGMVLDLWTNANKIGSLELDSQLIGTADILFSKIAGKISEKDLTTEEKTKYDKYGKKFSEERLKELNAATTNEQPENASSEAATQETTATEPKNAKLNKARQNNLKIIKAFKEVGLPADDLTVTAKNKNGKDYRKASDKLNKLRKTLFGEALDEDENPFNQEF
jgi:hypothetical protein